jgi:uncharacterized low-complexity protein
MQRGKQLGALTAAIVLVLSACASQDMNQEAPSAAPTTISESVTTQSTSETSGEGAGGEETSTSTTAVASDSAVQIEGPAAPDFTFALADGSGFSLSGEQKPVYLVFWAEW